MGCVWKSSSSEVGEREDWVNVEQEKQVGRMCWKGCPSGQLGTEGSKEVARSRGTWKMRWGVGELMRPDRYGKGQER